jgi:geranylgeranyl diphosphate synthase, type II
MSFDDYLREKRALVDAALERYLPSTDTLPRVIHEAMRYAVLGGGKRLRPIVAIAAAEASGANPEPLMQAFAALELIHTYSLVHDDLPALDDDDLRRGRKTTHVVFGEAMGILAGDALLTEAFTWLATPLEGVDAARQLRAVREVAIAVDSKGMIGGQVADLEATGEQTGMSALHGAQTFLSAHEQLQFIHENKTGKLLTVSALLGGLLGGASDETLEALRRYGNAMGLAFQIIDDLLDIEADAATLGKTAGKDVAQGKLTYPALLGVEPARAEAQRLLEVTVGAADMIRGPANYLADIARYICSRRN